jgi:hypothetical protein
MPITDTLYGLITGTLSKRIGDIGDDDQAPERIPLVGVKATFTPDLIIPVVRHLPPNKREVVYLEPVGATTNEYGELVALLDPQLGVPLHSSIGGMTDPASWTWTLTLEAPTFPTVKVTFTLAPGETKDIADLIAVPVNPGTALAAWQAAVTQTALNVGQAADSAQAALGSELSADIARVGAELARDAAGVSATAAEAAKTAADTSAATATTKAAQAVTEAAAAEASAVRAKTTADAVPATNDGVVRQALDLPNSQASGAAFRLATSEPAVTHDWLGTPHASASVRKLDGAVAQTNLAPNPSFEAATPGATVVRTNVYAGNRIHTGSDGVILDKDVTLNGERWDRITFLNSTRLFRVYAEPNTLKNGATYTSSFEVYNPGPGVVDLGLDWCDVAPGAFHKLQPGERKRIHVTATKATYDMTYRFLDVLAVTAGGQVVYARNIMIEQTDQLRPYFDGSTPDALGFDYSWSGVAGTSTSTAKATLTEVQTNLAASDPLCRAGISSINFVGSGTNTWEQGGGPTPDIVNFARRTLTGVPTGTQGAYRTNPTTGWVAGDSFTATQWVRFPIAGTVLATVEFGNGLANISKAHTVAANTWALISVTGTVPAGFAYFNPTAYMNGVFQAGQPIDTTGLLIVKAPNAATLPFDGATPSLGDFIYIWTGSANASTSQQAGIRTSVLASSTPAIYSCEWSAAGNASVRLTPPTANNWDTWIAPLGDTGAMRGGMLPGRTYTVVAHSRISTPLAVDGDRGRTIKFFHRTAAVSYVQLTSAKVPNVPGSIEHRFTFTVPTDATEAFVRLYSGQNQSANDVWWDSFTLVEGDYTGPAFHGSTPARRVVDALDERYAPRAPFLALAGQNLSGVGSPQGVVTAAVGTEYTDTAATLGAVKWLKTSGTGNTGWRVLFGDTGARSVAIANGSLTLSRVGDRVEVSVAITAAVTAGDSYLAYTLPAGFVPARVERLGGYFEGASYAQKSINVVSDGRLLLRGTSGSGAIYGATSFLTAHPWPTTLPGTPA